VKKLRAQGLFEALEQSFLDALRAPDGSVAPAALLWADPGRQWTDVIPRLQAALPHLFVLGNYDQAKRTGPAIWLRCVVDHVLPDVELPRGVVPVLYLPGVARQLLRAGDECPRELQPLVELQYRGRVWHQRNGRDWTVDAFLVSEDGLGLEVAQDGRTREAALRSLPLLADTPLEGLRGHRLESDDFDRLAVSDAPRDLLRWMGTGDAFRSSEGEVRWKAFCGVCIAEFKFDPDKRSPGEAASALVEGVGKWNAVWQRFREAPKIYPGVSQLLRELPGQLRLGFDPERSPRDNEHAERRLRKDLEDAANVPHSTAIAKIEALEAEHRERRDWVWAQLGASPLAGALAPLARLATAAVRTLGGATVDAAVEAYVKDGWRCDRAALEALASVKAPADVSLVQSVVRALYLPWLDASARHFQSLVEGAENAARALVSGTQHEKDSCLMFADGLRYDLAVMLADRLEAKGLRTRLNHRLAPLPTVTATAKPYASLSHDELEGGEDIIDFNPRFKNSTQQANARRLRDDMAARGIDLLGEEIRPAKQGTTGGWLETGRLDELGHKLGDRLASQIDTELDMLIDQITGLLEVGWTRIRIVTDHGWLLMPGGLPHVAVPSHLTATKWSRCATVKRDARLTVPTHSWHWNPHVRIASPPGVGSFAPNTEYSHGGISPQECIVPELIIERGGASTRASITGVGWRGMRCRVSVETNDPAVRVDLRLKWKEPVSTIAAAVKEVGPSGEASIAVADDSHEGHAATIVALDAAGNVLDRMPTTVGESA
jgi:hypothetical protein